MTATKKLTLSLIVPVYNEQAYISACLESIARQNEMPDEVIVVDNNSTDRTAEIVKRYKFVRIVNEPQQHQAFAQKRGFDEAKSDILGRIDADTILPRDWVSNVKAAFQDSDLLAIDGEGDPYDVSAMTIARIGFSLLHRLSGALGGTKMLWGANCAIRRSAWLKISPKVLLRDDIWEDHDLSYQVGQLGQARRLKNITVGFSLRSVGKNFPKQVSYQFRSIRTVYLHRGFWRAAITLLIWSLTILLFPLLMVDKFILKPLAKIFGVKFGIEAYLKGR